MVVFLTGTSPIILIVCFHALLSCIHFELYNLDCLCSHTGHGNFGSVLKGEYTKGDGEKIPVAVKKLKSEEMNNPKVHVNSRLLLIYNHVIYPSE